MSLFGRSSKQNWNKQNDGTYATPEAHRGFTAVIDGSSGQYVLTITGSGAPSATTWATLKLAKASFSEFLRAH